VVLKPVKRLPKEEETKEEISLKPVKKEKPEEKAEEVRLKPVKRIEKPEEEKPEEVVLKPVKRLPKEEETKEEISLKPVKKEKPEEKPEEVRLKPVKRIEESEEEKPEEVVLKPVKRLPKEEETKEEISLKPVRKEKPEEKPEEVRLKPVKRIKKPEEEKSEEVVLKPIKRLPKKEEIKEQTDLKPMEKKEYAEIISKPELVSKIVDEFVEDKPTELTAAPWRRTKRAKKVVDFREEVTVVPIDQEESVTEVCEQKETIITTLDIQEQVEKEIEPVQLHKEEKVIQDDIITSEVSWRKKKQEPLEEMKVEISETTQPEEHILIPIKDEKLSEIIEKDTIELKSIPKKKKEEKLEEIKLKPISKEKIMEKKPKEEIIELKSIKLKEQTAKVEEKDETIIETVKTIRKKEKLPEEIVPIKEKSEIIIETKEIKEMVEDVELQVKKDITQIEDRKRKRKQRTQVDISIIDKDKTIAPRFIQKLQPVIVELEKPAKFTCTVIGNPIPEISWYKNEQELHASEKYTMTIFETTATLEITKVKEEDVAMYSCRASNPAGVATSTVNLVIFGSSIIGCQIFLILILTKI